MKNSIQLLEQRGVKSTPNRLLTLQALAGASAPVSLADLEGSIGTMDRSSIFRCLVLFQRHGLVHAIEDGTGAVKYELCHGEGHCSTDDMHVHFHCERCHRTLCMEDTPLPKVALPEGYVALSAAYLVKGVCSSCSAKAD